MSRNRKKVYVIDMLNKNSLAVKKCEATEATMVISNQKL